MRTLSPNTSTTVSNQRSIAIIGLGKMGGNMARRLAQAGFVVHGHDPAAASSDYAADRQIRLHANAAAAVKACAQSGAARVVWLMLPAGEATSAAINKIAPLLSKGDMLVDGGNANYRDSQQRGKQMLQLGLHFVDCGVSGGVWGLANGYCLMFGASRAAAKILTPYVKALAVGPDRGWLHCGPVGSGHFTKMIHNGIEYGMMQALAEGFALMEAKKDFAMPIADIAEAWRDGSVVRSWLLDLTASALQKPDEIAAIAPYVADSGEGRWAVEAMIDLGVPAPVTALALTTRFATQGKGDYAAKLLAQMRAGFGGHAVKKQ